MVCLKFLYSTLCEDGEKVTQLVCFLVVVSFAVPLTSLAQDYNEIENVVVTAPLMSDPLTVELDPGNPIQPVPASDGASFLKNVPGFSMARQGGTDGEPAFRGLGGSRLNISQDGANIWGGCANRMDPPTAYVYPETFDTVTITKGPQSVLYGGGNVAGTVLLERNTEPFTEPGYRVNGSLLFGSHARNDQVLDVSSGASEGYFRVIGTRSDAEDYQDGSGKQIHSFYTRWSGTAIVGWTPFPDTLLEVAGEWSDGEAAYDNRSMDGVEYARQGYSVLARRDFDSGLIQSVELKLFGTYIDHVMDNYSLRTPGRMKMVRNPDNDTNGARLSGDLALSEYTLATVGVDYQQNSHSDRRAMSMMAPVLPAREEDAWFENTGYFAELDHRLSDHDTISAGLRLDTAKAEAKKISDTPSNPWYGEVPPGTTIDDNNVGSFIRYQHHLTASPLLFSIGLGRAERSPDYWERSKSFYLEPETNTQLDLGFTYRSESIQANLSLFGSRIDNYILVTNNGTDAKNIDAHLLGGEGDIRFRLTDSVSFIGTLAYVHGINETDDKFLAQAAPLDGSVSLAYDDSTFSGGVILRGVARQGKIDEGNGSIIGTDISETPGFAVISLNAGYEAPNRMSFSAGIDNLLDKTYSEHLARGSADLGTLSGRVNEPGRTYWIKFSAQY